MPDCPPFPPCPDPDDDGETGDVYPPEPPIPPPSYIGLRQGRYRTKEGRNIMTDPEKEVQRK